MTAKPSSPTPWQAVVSAGERHGAWLIFHLGIPLILGLIIGATGATDWPAPVFVVSSIINSLIFWGGYWLATALAARVLRPWKPSLLVILLAGWGLATPLLAVIMQWRIYATEVAFLGVHASSQPRFPPIGQVYGQSITGLIIWVGTAYAFHRWLKLSMFGFDSAAGAGGSGQDSGGHDVKAAPTAEYSSLLARLPPHLGTDVLAIAAEEHYVRVYTPVGSALILYRISDAVREMGDRGVTVHRSYWVARHAVKSSARSGQSVVLELTNGLKVPVSRGLLRTARDANLI